MKLYFAQVSVFIVKQVPPSKLFCGKAPRMLIVFYIGNLEFTSEKAGSYPEALGAHPLYKGIR